MTPSPAQIAARERFAARARAGDFKRGLKRKRNPEGVSQWGTPIDTDLVPGVAVNWTDTRHGEVRRFDTDLHVGRESIDPGWFVFGRWAGASANVVKRIAWPDAPLRRWPKISRLVQPGWRTKGEAQAVADQLRRLLGQYSAGTGAMRNPRQAAPALTRARRLYRAYKTTTREYKDLASQLGYTPGELNARFASETDASGRRINPREKDPMELGGIKGNPGELTVANTILAQLGGHRFLAMTGAKNLLGDPDSLTFTLPARLARDGINKVRIILAPDDTYNMQFLRYSLRAAEPLRMVKQLHGVYADSLREAFTTYTGLQVSLGTMGRNPRRRKPETVRTAPGPERLAEALKALRGRIARGQELPDAAYQVSAHFVVPYEALADAYDAADREPRKRRRNPAGTRSPDFMVTHFPVNAAWGLTWGDSHIGVSGGSGATQKLFPTRAELVEALRRNGLHVDKGGRVTGELTVRAK